MMGSREQEEEHLYMSMNELGLPSHHQLQDEEIVKQLWNKTLNVQWSHHKYNISEFLSLFELPQIVKVHKVNADENVCNLKEGEILVIHKFWSVEKVIATDSLGDILHLPLQSPKVDLRDISYSSTYNSVEELANDMPNFVRVGFGSHGNSQESSISPGRKLVINKVDYENLVLECQDFETGKNVQLSKTCNATFHPLADTREYTLEEVVTLLRLPAYVQFIDNIQDEEHHTLQSTLTSYLGLLRIERPFADTSLIASINTPEGIWGTVFSQDSELEIRPAQGAIKSDAEYKKLCERFNKVISFHELEETMLADVYNEHKKRYLLGYDILNKSFEDSSSEDKTHFHSEQHHCGLKTSPRVQKRRQSVPTNFLSPQFQGSGKDRTQKKINSEWTPVRFYSEGHATQTLSKKPLSLTGKELSQQRHNLKPPVAKKPTHVHKKMLVAHQISQSQCDSNLQSETEHYRIPTETTEGVNERIRSFSVGSPRSSVSGSTTHSHFSKQTIERGIYDTPKSSKSETVDSRMDENEIYKTPPKMRTLYENTTNQNSHYISPVTQGAHKKPSIKRQGIPSPQKANSETKVLDLPDDLGTSSVQELCLCLEQMNMGEYVEVFQEEEIDGNLLMSLDEDALLSLGITKFHSIKIRKLIAGWRPRKGQH